MYILRGACEPKNGGDKRLKPPAKARIWPGCDQDFRSWPIIRPVEDLFAQSLQIAVDHFSAGAIYVCLCRDAMASHPGLMHLQYELLLTVLLF